MAKTGDEKKDGVSIQQIENFGKHNRIEIFFCIAFILASFFSFLFYGPGWSVYAAGIGSVVAVWLPKPIGRFMHAVFKFCVEQQKTTRLVIAIVGIVLSIFLPPLVFLSIGLMAGRGAIRYTIDAIKMSGCCKHEDEHHE